MTQVPDTTSAALDDAQPQSITINIKSTNAKYTVSVPLTLSVLDLKSKLSASEYADVPASAQRLIYSGRVLKDGDSLESYKVKDGNTIHLVKSAPSNQRQNPAAQTSSTSTDSTPGSNVPRPTGVPSNIAAGTGNNPLAGLTGARYAGFAQLPGAGMFGPDGGMGPPPSQDQMIEMLSNPALAQQMNEALQNPAVIDMMIQQSPHLRQMGPAARQMLQSEGFRRMMTNPDQLRAMGRLQSAMGGLGLEGQGQGGFPMPGVTDTTPAENRNTSDDPETSGQASATEGATNDGGNNAGAPNPFAALFGAPPPGANQQNAEGNNAPPGQNQNPFAALFGSLPPNMGMQQDQNQTGTDAPTNAPANPFANLQNNPLFQNPELMAQMMRAMGGGDNQGGGNTGTAGTAGNADMFAQMANLLGSDGLAGGGAAGNMFGAPPDNRPPQERYATQLRQLNEMGFFDYDRNIQALQRSGGDVNGALEWLFSQP